MRSVAGSAGDLAGAVATLSSLTGRPVSALLLHDTNCPTWEGSDAGQEVAAGVNLRSASAHGSPRDPDGASVDGAVRQEWSGAAGPTLHAAPVAASTGQAATGTKSSRPP